LPARPHIKAAPAGRPETGVFCLLYTIFYPAPLFFEDIIALFLRPAPWPKLGAGSSGGICFAKTRAGCFSKALPQAEIEWSAR